MSTRATRGTMRWPMCSAAREMKKSGLERSNNRENLMIRRHLFTALLLGALVVAGRTAMAHHAFGAEFDPNAPIRLQGKVTRLEWVNPHTWIHIEVVKEGKPEIWMVEGGTPNTLL